MRKRLIMNKLDYQVKVSKLLDEALNELDTDGFNDLIYSIKEALEDYKFDIIAKKEG